MNENENKIKPADPYMEKSVIKRLSVMSIAGNTVLSGIKLLAGIFGHSGAMISDAVHSFSDVFTTVIAVIGVKISKRGADKEHPYGHERYESLASLVLGLILLATGFGIGREGVLDIVSGNYSELAVPNAAALAAAVLSIAVKEAMYWYTKYYAGIINSQAFLADAWHHRSDALSSVGSLIGIGGAMLGFPVMDPIASLVICLFIFKVAFDILKDGVSKMLDTSCGECFDNEVRDFITSQNDTVRIDVLQSRTFGSKVYIDLEIAMDGSITLEEAHETAEDIHEKIEEHFPCVKHVMIHVNPFE